MKNKQKPFSLLLVCFLVVFVIVSGIFVFRYVDRHPELLKEKQTVQDNESDKTQTLLTIGKELYTDAYDAYWFRLFEMGSEIEQEGSHEGYVLSNYDAVMERYFTVAGKRQFERVQKDMIFSKGDQMYRVKDLKDPDDTYQATDLELISHHGNTVKYQATVRYETKDGKETRKRQTFTIVFDDKTDLTLDHAKIESFVLPD